jgi:hypothetical protein
MANGYFLKHHKNAARDRVMGHCSNPACLKPTVGPSLEPFEVWVTGQAAHIRGRASTAARHDESMTDDERADPSNLIWLCADCHKKVDDERRYPATALEQWREQTENYCRALSSALQAPELLVLDCPWCKRLVPMSASRCANCCDVERDPQNLAQSAVIALYFIFVVGSVGSLHALSALRQWSFLLCCLLSGALTLFVAVRTRERFVALDAQERERNGERFVRIMRVPEGNGWRTEREHRYAKPRAISSVELSRHGIGIQV